MTGPFSGTEQYYPFGGGKQPIGAWYLWNLADGPLTIQLNTSTPVQSIWIPQLVANVNYFEGPPNEEGQPVGTAFYESPFNSGPEVVPMNQGYINVVLQSASDTGTMYVFATTGFFDPFRAGPTAAISQIEADPPIEIGGTPSIPLISLQVPLATIYGGTGETNPSLIPGAGIDISGAWPNQEISSTATGTVTAVTASAPITSSEGTTPNIGMTTPLPENFGGTGTETPFLDEGPGISITGSVFAATIGIDPTQNLTKLNGVAGLATLVSSNASITITPNSPAAGDIDLIVAAPPAALTTAIGTGVAPSITLPGTSSDEYRVILDFGFSQNSNANATVTITLSSGTATMVGNTGDGTLSQNASYYSLAKWVGTAHGGQTLDFNVAIAGSGFESEAWSIIASTT
jgi:hypothetical protein